MLRFPVQHGLPLDSVPNLRVVDQDLGHDLALI
jgi:hypothetical protein